NSQGVPRYLDLAAYEDSQSVPFTHSSNLLAALERSLALTPWPRKFERVREWSADLRAALRLHGLPPLAQNAHAAPGIITVALPEYASSADVARALSDEGIQIAW